MGVTAQDKKIAGMIQEARKPCIVAINKWDLIKDETDDKESLNAVARGDARGALLPRLRARAARLRQDRRGTDPLLQDHRADQKRSADPHRHRRAQPPLRRGDRRAPAAVAGGGASKCSSPPRRTRTRSPIPIPEIVLFCNDEKLLVDSYRRFLEAKVRATWPYTGLPLLFHLRPREVKGSAKQAARGRKGGEQKPKTPRGEEHASRKKKQLYPEGKKRPARGITGRRQGG